MIQILVWWLILQVLGWLALPTAMRIFRWLPDRGYTFSKALGLLLISYVLWMGASTGLLTNVLGGILFSIILLAGISAWFYFRNRGNLVPDIRTFLREKWKLVLTVEILFTLALVGWALLRAYAPYKIEPTGGEKFMEIAFQNGILRSERFPPLDSWLSGFAISYYYFGYVMMALLTRLSGAVSGVGFDLYDALLFSLTLIGSFGVVYNLVAFTLKARHKGDEAAPPEGPPLATGVLGGLMVTVMGNLEGVLEVLHAWGVLPDSFWRWIDIPGLAQAPVINSWYPGDVFMWWWRASRVLADKNFAGQDIGVQPIDEFPFFSFLLGDNHPHVLALPFVLLAIGLAFNLLLRQMSEERILRRSIANVLRERGKDRDSTIEDADPEPQSRPHWWNPVAFALDNDWWLFIFSALILGALGFLNTWDLPIYLGLVVLAYGLGSVMVKGRVERDTITRSIILGLGLGVLSGLLYIFFYLSFSSQAAGVLPYVFPPTRLPQYLVMFGTFIFIVVCFLLIYLIKNNKEYWGKIKTALTWWWRILLICLGFYIVILLLIALVLFLQKLLPDSTMVATIQSVIGGLSLSQAFGASVGARLRNPWLVLMVSALLALVMANLGSLLRRRSKPEDEGTVGDSSPHTFSSDPFVFLLIFTGLALTLIVEFIYLRDSFGVRMNTVFKFYYQAWVMLGGASAYAVWWLLDRLERPASRLLFILVAVFLIGLGMVYPLMAIPSRAADFKGPANLDGSSAIARDNPDDWAAIQWLDKNALEGIPAGTVPVILEAPSVPPAGGSYTYEGRISAFTGFPSVLGWAVHESQWRGNYDEQGKREPDIATIYTTSDGQTALDLLHKWNVSYVIVNAGNNAPELRYIQRLCSQPERGCTMSTALRKFDQVLQPIFSQGQLTIYKVP
jgi:YYY domain-containing protein